MATLDEIGQEKQRIAERLARLDSDRTKLSERLNELEIAERVLAQFGKAEAATPRRRGRPARTAAGGAGERRPRVQRAQAESGLSLSDATLRAVQAHPEGVSAGDVLSYLSQELGMAVRPNHLGIALQRHRRAGRLDNRDRLWYPPQRHHDENQPSAMND